MVVYVCVCVERVDPLDPSLDPSGPGCGLPYVRVQRVCDPDVPSGRQMEQFLQMLVPTLLKRWRESVCERLCLFVCGMPPPLCLYATLTMDDNIVLCSTIDDNHFMVGEAEVSAVCAKKLKTKRIFACGKKKVYAT